MTDFHVFPKGHRCRRYTLDAGRIECKDGFSDRLCGARIAPDPTREPYDADAHRALRLAADNQIVHERSALRHRSRDLSPQELLALRQLHNRGYLDRTHPWAARNDDTQHVIAPTDHGRILLTCFAQHHTITPAMPSKV